MTAEHRSAALGLAPAKKDIDLEFQPRRKPVHGSPPTGRLTKVGIGAITVIGFYLLFLHDSYRGSRVNKPLVSHDLQFKNGGAALDIEHLNRNLNDRPANQSSSHLFSDQQKHKVKDAVVAQKKVKIGAKSQQKSKEKRQRKKKSIPRDEPAIVPKFPTAWPEEEWKFIDDHLAQDDFPKPLVTLCVITRDRPVFLNQAVRLIAKQTYPNVEAIVVDDSVIPANHRGWPSNVRYHFLTNMMTIGAKRNVCAQLSQGAIIMHWDDDDYYAPTRVQEQTLPIRQGKADITVYENGLQFFVNQVQFYRPAWPCFWGPHYGTLTYKRSVLDDNAFRDASKGEDYGMATRAVVIHGARIEVVRNVKSFIYVRHNKNTYMPPADEWNSLIPVPFPPFVAGADATFYKSLVENQEVQESKMESDSEEIPEDKDLDGLAPGNFPCKVHSHSVWKFEQVIPQFPYACCLKHYTTEGTGISLPEFYYDGTTKEERFQWELDEHGVARILVKYLNPAIDD